MVAPFTYLLRNSFTCHAHVYMYKANKKMVVSMHGQEICVLLEKFSWGNQVSLIPFPHLGNWLSFIHDV